MRITPSFPAPSTLPSQPAWLGPGWTVGQAAGGEGMGQCRPSVPAHQLATQLEAAVCYGCATKLPATPWTGWALGALCQDTCGPLSSYASWWVPQAAVLWTLSPLNLQPGDWGEKVHFFFLLLGFWAGSRQEMEGEIPQETPPPRCPGDYSMILKMTSNPSLPTLWGGAAGLRFIARVVWGGEGLSAGGDSSRDHMVDSFNLSLAGTILLWCIWGRAWFCHLCNILKC